VLRCGASSYSTSRRPTTTEETNVIGDHERDIGVLSVRGRKLENPNAPAGHLGTIGVLRRADAEAVKAARRHLREIPEREFRRF
jgi:hypothetical protein